MINRRHFLSHLSASAALSTQFTNFSNSIAANAVENRNIIWDFVQKMIGIIKPSMAFVY
jgi:hypothetical protein